VNLKISIDGLEPNSLQLSGSTKTVLTSGNVMDENSFSQPKKVPSTTFTLSNLLIYPSEYCSVYYTTIVTPCMNCVSSK